MDIYVYGRVQAYSRSQRQVDYPLQIPRTVGSRTRGLDGCLFVYPMDSWGIYVEELKKLPLTDRNARLFTRFIIAGATTCELDRQGRILLPVTLREFAGIDKDILLAGMLDHIEIWNEERWKENADFSDMDTIASHLNDLNSRV